LSNFLKEHTTLGVFGMQKTNLINTREMIPL